MRYLSRAALTAALVLFVGGLAHAEGWGTVKGQVTWGGKAPPAPAKLNVDKDQNHCLKNGPLFSQEFVVNDKNGGVKNVFVWLVDATNPKKKLPIHPALKAVKDKEVVIDQPCCQFEPHCVALRAEQVLIGRNSAPINHNMKWTGGNDNPGDNKIIPPGQQIKIELIASARPIIVECNIHPWMKAWVRVFDHPYFALTDENGKFEIKNAPAGRYNIIMWQEGVGWVNGGREGQPITIPAGAAVVANGKVTPEEK
jgi:hypothetical protein